MVAAIADLFLTASCEDEDVGINDEETGDFDEFVDIESFDLIPNSPDVSFARLP